MHVRARVCACVRKRKGKAGGREGKREADKTDTGCVGASRAVSRNQGMRAVCFLKRK